MPGRAKSSGIELLPNVIGPLIVYATILVGFMILVAAGLSFFGLGASPPPPTGATW